MLKSKRILITGASGFLGQHLTRIFKNHRYKKILTPTHRDYNLIKSAEIHKMIRDLKPAVVIHLAARVGGIGINRKNPGLFFYENAIMGIELIEASRRANVEKFVAIGTVCAYPKWTHVPFKEETIWDGYPEETNAPYGLAKKMLLVQEQAYRAQYGFKSIYLIPVNMYGPGDNFDLKTSHVIPALIRKFNEAIQKRRNHVVLWGNGSSSREFLYGEDCAEAICLATEKYNKPEPVNIGTGNEISIRNLAKMIKVLTGFKGRIVWDIAQPNGQPRRSLNTHRAWKEFGFKAKTPLEKGLIETIRWYQNTYSK